MKNHDKIAVQTVLDGLELGERGTVPLQALELASDASLVALASAVPHAPMHEIVSVAVGDDMSNEAYAAIFQARAEILGLIELAKQNSPAVLTSPALSVGELVELASGNFAALVELTDADLVAAEQAVMLWEPEQLLHELTLAAAGATIEGVLTKPVLTAADQVTLAGLLVLDPNHPMAQIASLSITEPWRATAAFLGDCAAELV
jgi:hypothetical protein